MMSDHWKSIANLLGTPGPAEPVAKETTKKKVEAPFLPKMTEETPPNDPLAAIVDRKPEPTVPGFDVPPPAPAPEKPAKRSAWDSLIGALGIKTASESDAPLRDETSEAPRSAEAIGASGLGNSPTMAHDETRPRTRSGRGFGAGLVDNLDGDDEPAEINAPEPPKNLRQPTVNVPSPVPPTSSPRRHDSPRRPEERDSTPRSREKRPPRQDDRSSRRNEREPVRREFGRPDDDLLEDDDTVDGILDWGVDTDDDLEVTLEDDFDDDDLLDGGDLIDDEDEPVRGKGDSPANRDDSRREGSRPAGRGRRGGARGRGRDRERSFEPAVPPADDRLEAPIGWDLDEPDERIEPTRSGPAERSGRRDEGQRSGREPRRPFGEADRGREPRRENLPRTEKPVEDITRDETQQGADDSLPASGHSRRRGRRGQRQQLPGDAPEVRSSREPQAERPPRQDRPPRQERGTHPAQETRPEREPRPERSNRPDTEARPEREPRGARAPRPVRENEGQSVPRPDRESRPRREHSRPTEPAAREIDDDLDFDDLIDEELSLPPAIESDSDDGPSRPRRRRGRRGRGGADRGGDSVREPRSPVSEDLPFDAELGPEAIDPIADDDREDDEETQRLRRGRRRGRGRGGRRDAPTASAETDSVEVISALGEESGVSSKPRHVPTWLDTVSLLVEPNIERHRRSGPPRPSQGRGGRR